MNNRITIETDEDGNIIRIELFHIINGEWIHVTQNHKENKDIEYYTNGVKEESIVNECTLT